MATCLADAWVLAICPHKHDLTLLYTQDSSQSQSHNLALLYTKGFPSQQRNKNSSRGRSSQRIAYPATPCVHSSCTHKGSASSAFTRTQLPQKLAVEPQQHPALQQNSFMHPAHSDSLLLYLLRNPLLLLRHRHTLSLH